MFLNPRRTRAGVSRSSSVGFSQGRRRSAAIGRARRSWVWAATTSQILVVFDAPRMAYLVDGLPVEVLGRMRADRVMRRPTPSLKEYALAYPQGGRTPKHGKEFRTARPDTWGDPGAETVQVTDRYGTAQAMA